MGLQLTKLPGLRLSRFASTRVDRAIDAKETYVPLGVNDLCSLGSLYLGTLFPDLSIMPEIPREKQ